MLMLMLLLMLVVGGARVPGAWGLAGDVTGAG